MTSFLIRMEGAEGASQGDQPICHGATIVNSFKIHHRWLEILEDIEVEEGGQAAGDGVILPNLVSRMRTTIHRQPLIGRH